jgi:uncharacterized glyoxalase superfamily protein PhnB
MNHAPIEPHLWSADVPGLAAFWVDVLGFELAQRYPETDPMSWCQLARGQATVMIAAFHDPQKPPHEAAAPLWKEVAARFGSPGAVVHYVRVADVDQVYRQVTAAGVTPLEALWDAWWGYREFTISDPDGNLVCLFTPRPK